MGPNYYLKCPYEEEKEGCLIRRGGGDAMLKAEIGVMHFEGLEGATH